MTHATQAAGLLERVGPDVVAARQAVLDHGDPGAIHALRQSLRRARALLRLMQRESPSPALADLRSLAKAAADAVAPVRNWDVLVADTLPAAHRDGLDVAIVDCLTVAARERRAVALALAQTALRSQRLRRLPAALRDIAVPVPVPAHDEVLAAALLPRLHRRLLCRGRGFRHLDARGRHQLRLAGKALTDVAGLLHPPHGLRRRALRLTNRLTAAIGNDRDCDTALALAAVIGDPFVTRALAIAIAQGADRRERSMRQQWRALCKAPAPRPRARPRKPKKKAAGLAAALSAV